MFVIFIYYFLFFGFVVWGVWPYASTYTNHSLIHSFTHSIIQLFTFSPPTP